MSHRFSYLASVASFGRDEIEIPVEELTKRTTSYGPRTLRDVGSGLVRGSEKPHMLSKTGQYRNCPHGEIDMK
ncbi:hypothetical protein MCOR02_007390 [Pyricularia oryzae]|uniref:Uncharacterized protein n=1 Tax=Pyricularia oryzae TaxID=318829 RepID=A0A4V1C7T8_PYROR|nr:hypothetical protein MCOR02_007390 [Pyricularia oryzae]KAI7929209.1 hypothetical protein M9X92_001403 [Pyricularia oryzae]KAI7930072.1 hypothetical protein M0657_001877 [Pyricularia oryzae]QBZ64538.1 hypothetical protein PoMZ_06236 [Pyricularia oryzae]